MKLICLTNDAPIHLGGADNANLSMKLDSDGGGRATLVKSTANSPRNAYITTFSWRYAMTPMHLVSGRVCCPFFCHRRFAAHARRLTDSDNIVIVLQILYKTQLTLTGSERLSTQDVPLGGTISWRNAPNDFEIRNELTPTNFRMLCRLMGCYLGEIGGALEVLF